MAISYIGELARASVVYVSGPALTLKAQSSTKLRAGDLVVEYIINNDIGGTSFDPIPLFDGSNNSVPIAQTLLPTINYMDDHTQQNFNGATTNLANNLAPSTTDWLGFNTGSYAFYPLVLEQDLAAGWYAKLTGLQRNFGIIILGFRGITTPVALDYNQLVPWEVQHKCAKVLLGRLFYDDIGNPSYTAVTAPSGGLTTGLPPPTPTASCPNPQDFINPNFMYASSSVVSNPSPGAGVQPPITADAELILGVAAVGVKFSKFPIGATGTYTMTDASGATGSGINTTVVNGLKLPIHLENHFLTNTPSINATRQIIPFFEIVKKKDVYNFGVNVGVTTYVGMAYRGFVSSVASPPIMDAKKDRNEQLITIWDDSALVPFGYNTERTELEVYTQPPATTQSFFTSARSGTISVKQWGYTNGYWISTVDDSLQGNFNDPFFGRAGAFIFLPQSPKKMNTVHANYDHIFRWDYLVSTAKTSDSLNNTLWFARNLGGDSWYKFNNGNVWKQIFNSTSGSPVAVTGQFANTTLKEAIIVLRYIDMGGAMKQLFSKDMGESWDDNWQFTEPYDGVPNHAPDLGIGNVKNFCVFFDYVTRITYITGVFDDGGDVGKIFFARHLGGKDFFNFNNGNFVKTLPANIQGKVASTLSKNGSLVLKYVDKDGNLKKLISDNHGETWKDTWYVGPSGIGL